MNTNPVKRAYNPIQDQESMERLPSFAEADMKELDRAVKKGPVEKSQESRHGEYSPYDPENEVRIRRPLFQDPIVEIAPFVQIPYRPGRS